MVVVGIPFANRAAARQLASGTWWRPKRIRRGARVLAETRSRGDPWCFRRPFALRQQLAIFQRRRPRPPLAWSDRVFWVAFSSTWSRWRDVLLVVRPDTVERWHRAAFRRFWTWRSRRPPGRPPTERDVRVLVRRMAQTDPLMAAQAPDEDPPFLARLGVKLAQLIAPGGGQRDGVELAADEALGV
jgi:hypothetical protein